MKRGFSFRCPRLDIAINVYKFTYINSLNEIQFFLSTIIYVI